MTLGVPTSPGVAAAAARRHAAGALQRSRVGAPASSSAHRGQIAAIFVEPIAGNMGLVAAAATDFSRGCATLCDRARHAARVRRSDLRLPRRRRGARSRYSACGRISRASGKIIGGGLPVGAYGGRADIMELVAPAGPVYQAGTLSGNPLAMTAGLWALQELSPRLYQAPGEARRAARRRARRRGARRRRAAAGQRVRLAGHAVLHRPPRPRLPVGARRPTPPPTGGSSGACSSAASTCRRRSSRRGSCRAPTQRATSRRRSKRAGRVQGTLRRDRAPSCQSSASALKTGG